MDEVKKTDQRTYLLTVTYTEDSDTLTDAYGVTEEDVENTLRLFGNKEALGKSYSERMMELIADGRMTGGALLFFATQGIVKIIKNMTGDSEMREALMKAFLKLAKDSAEEDEE